MLMYCKRRDVCQTERETDVCLYQCWFEGVFSPNCYLMCLSALIHSQLSWERNKSLVFPAALRSAIERVSPALAQTSVSECL